ncbi:MAG: glucose 1-dehydrogenase [Planctomycetota bacterium]|nr:glucose 1-dehydrogenase [Planctomycetota bacterium]
MSHDPFDLSGRVVLVTGAGQGLGAAIAEVMAGHGARTVLLDIDSDAVTRVMAQIDAAGSIGVTEAAQCDVTDRLQVQQAVEQISERHGRIDVLVNNAGIHRRVDPVDWEQADVDALLSVNLLGSFYMATTVGRVMIEQRSGSIINMSALGGGLAGLGRSGSMYGMTKGGIVSLTRDLAAEWGRYAIRVNALAPGWIRTPMTNALQQNPERSAKVLERVPLGRWGEPQDVAGAALFLASDAARYITGHTIPIDGGAANVIALSE